MSSHKPFGCHDLLIRLTKGMKFMITYIFKSRSSPTLLGYDLIGIISSNIHLKLVYEQSMSSHKPFACHDLLI